MELRSQAEKEIKKYLGCFGGQHQGRLVAVQGSYAEDLGEEREGGDTVCEWKYWLAVTKGKPYKAKDTIKLGFDQINKGTLIVDVQWFELLGNDRHTAGIERASSIHRYKRLPEVCQIRVKSIIPNTNLKWKMI